MSIFPEVGQQSQICPFPFSRVVTQKNWKKRKLTAVSNLTIPFSRVVTQKNWKKRNLTAVSNLTIPFLKGCDPKELEEKKPHSNLKPHHSLSQGL